MLRWFALGLFLIAVGEWFVPVTRGRSWNSKGSVSSEQQSQYVGPGSGGDQGTKP
jgi:hypothetical protein